jgi:hypothetical protein
MKNLIYLLFFFSLTSLAVRSQDSNLGTFSGEVMLESRYFLNKGTYANTQQGDTSLLLRPEYSYSWNNDRKVITIIPYARLSQLDQEKTHADIREMSFVASWESLELRSGISKVFWGVTEGQHLVDVINQTDSVENVDGEDKLGQPMINPTLVTSWGNFDYFFLPYFRERTFSGEQGRFRGPLVIETDEASFLHKDQEKHIDHAFRWSHYYGPLEWGLSYFRGTDRSPNFLPNTNASKLTPQYVQTEQTALELQYVYNDWLFKSETLYKDSQLVSPYLAAVLGLEYTFSNQFGGMDIGLLYEWLYDERKHQSITGLYDASFFGTRLALNDELSSELLIGGIIHNQKGNLASLRVEGSRRINDNWKWELEANVFSAPTSGTLIHQVKEDDYLQFSLSFYF